MYTAKSVYQIFEVLYMCGISGTTWQSGWSLPWVLQPFLGNFMLTHFGCTSSESASLVLDITLSGGAMTSWRHTCTSHMTFCYKRSADTSFKAFWLLVCPSSLPLSPAYGWCLMRVGRDASSASPGWSLLPSSIFIVLALVNSTVSHKGT